MSQFVRDEAKYKTIDAVYQHSSVVRAILQSGGTMEDCVVVLYNQLQRTIDDLMKVESIAPKRYVLPNGDSYIWHCPDHLVPEVKLIKNRT